MAKEMDLNTLDAAPAAKAGPHADQPHRLSAAKRIRPARKAESRNASATHSKVLAAADIAVKAFIDAEEYGESADSSARLLAHAESQLHGLVSNIKRHPLTSVTAPSWMNRLADIQSMVEGAAAVDKDRSRVKIVSGLLKTLGGIVNMLDSPDWPHESDDDYHARDFMAGKGDAAQMIADAIALADDDAPALFATYRGRGVKQNRFVRTYIDRVVSFNQPEYTEGFCAVLAGTLSAAGSANINPEEVRTASYDDCVGGPQTKHMAEENEEEAVASHFMTGKQMAVATLIKLSTGYSSAAQLPANYRSDTRFVEQYNPIGQDMQYLLTRPELVEGYSAALTHAINEIVSEDDAVDMAKDVVRLTYEACRTDRPFKDGRAVEHYDNYGGVPPEMQLAAEGDSWRANLKKTLGTIDALILDAIKIAEQRQTHTLLLSQASRLIGKMTDDVDQGEKRSIAEADMVDLEALLIGAGGAPAVPPGVKALIEEAQLLQQDTAVYKAAAISQQADNNAAQADGEGAETVVRMDPGLKAATFISRLCDHLAKLQAEKAPITSQDIGAIHKAASVIMSSFSGDEGIEDELDRELEEALDSASVVLTAQPPKSTGLPVMFEGPVIDKKLLAAALVEGRTS